MLKVCKKVLSVMGLDKKSITTCHLAFIVKIVKIALIWSYFKFISIGFKQNLKLRYSKFYFKGQKKKNSIYNFFFFLGKARGFIMNPCAGGRATPGTTRFGSGGCQTTYSYTCRMVKLTIK